MDCKGISNNSLMMLAILLALKTIGLQPHSGVTQLFNENNITSVIAVLMVTLSVNGSYGVNGLTMQWFTKIMIICNDFSVERQGDAGRGLHDESCASPVQTRGTDEGERNRRMRALLSKQPHGGRLVLENADLGCEYNFLLP